MKLPARARVARYSGRERPAWRIIHSGVRGVGSHSSARSKRSFASGATAQRPPQLARIDAWIDSAAARGSAASRIGRPTTM